MDRSIRFLLLESWTDLFAPKILNLSVQWQRQCVGL